jgi:ornithine decarboxylase
VVLSKHDSGKRHSNSNGLGHIFIFSATRHRLETNKTRQFKISMHKSPSPDKEKKNKTNRIVEKKNAMHNGGFVDAVRLGEVGSEMIGLWSTCNSLDSIARACSYHSNKDESTTSSSEQHELDVFKEFLSRKELDSDAPVFFINLKKVWKRYVRWNTLFTNIKPYYAVKCNPDPAVIKTLALAGTNFDCASIQEIALVLSAGVGPERILFANPCKAEQAILYARSCQVKRMTFDNAEELEKIKALYPDCELILRIATDDQNASTVNLSAKFGASVESAGELLELAEQKNLKVIGISFHVGSGCHTPEAYKAAIEAVHGVINNSKGFDCEIVDIGGGYPGKEDSHDEELLEAIAKSVLETVDKCFGSSAKKPEIIAEPGRYFVQSSHVLGTCIIARHINSSKRILTITEGIYGSFKDRILVNEAFDPIILLENSADVKDGSPLNSMIIGPSGHVMDVICPSLGSRFSSLQVGDWVGFRDMGAYTLSLSSCHYLYGLPTKTYVWI